MIDGPVQTGPAAPRGVGEGDVFEWRVHPALERPFAALTAVVVILAMGLAVYVAFRSRLWAIFATVVLCLSLSRFFFASSYRIDAAGITARSLFGRRTLLLSEVRQVAHGGHGAWVAPRTPSRVRESRRGILLLFGRHRETVLAQLRRRLPADCVKRTGTGRPGQAS